jgi:hypothetical protein
MDHEGLLQNQSHHKCVYVTPICIKMYCSEGLYCRK